MAYRKKLIEVALPLEAISEAAAKEKTIHTGTLANMHTWWSRKPLAAARAIIFASLVDDPGNDLSPEKAEKDRTRLFHLIEQLVQWENMNDSQLIAKVRAEIAKSSGGTTLSFVDPFCGGGSLPLEAARLGLKAYASDLNPVAVLLTKAMVEIAPRTIGHSPVNPNIKNASTDQVWSGVSGLIEDLRYYGQWMSVRAKEQLGSLYPKVRLPKEYGGKETEVIAWLWARTVECPNPTCKGRAPLVNKFWVSTHKGNEAWVEPIVEDGAKKVRFEVRKKGPPPPGTVTKSGARCQICKSKTPIPFPHIRNEGTAGRMGYQLMTVVADSPGGRLYLPPDELQGAHAEEAHPTWVPDTSLPAQALGFRVQRYGMTKHKDLFTARQLLAVTTFCDLVSAARDQVLSDSGGDSQYADAVATFLAFIVNRLAQTNNTLVRWLVRKSGTSKGTPAFDRQVVSMVWEFSEGNIFGESVGSWKAAINNVLTAFNVLPKQALSGLAVQLDAASAMATQDAPVVSIDPPYFDNIGYADLSDFYYIWLRKSLSKIYPELFSTLLVPKQQELIAAPHLFDGDSAAAKEHFIQGLQKAFSLIRQKANPAYPVTVYYAFKQKEESEEDDSDEGNAIASTGWETMLEALLGAGFSVNGTWPIRTEQLARLRAVGSNALASSIVLVCRPRPDNAPRATRRELVSKLRRELPDALKKLQQGNIAPVDLAQATIGPGMAIFSQFDQVLEADGSTMHVRPALQLINQELDRFLAEQEGEYDADTRFCIAWYEQHGMEEGVFGEADVLARAKDTSVNGLEQAGVLVARAGKVRLLTRDEIDPEWDPHEDKRLTVWEAVQHLVRTLDKSGEQQATQLMNHLGSLGEVARDLSYRLYNISDRKGWSQDALGYNMLVVAWPRLVDIVGQQQSRQTTLPE